jgi:hypothetical protein
MRIDNPEEGIASIFRVDNNQNKMAPCSRCPQDDNIHDIMPSVTASWIVTATALGTGHSVTKTLHP